MTLQSKSILEEPGSEHAVTLSQRPRARQWDCSENPPASEHHVHHLEIEKMLTDANRLTGVGSADEFGPCRTTH